MNALGVADALEEQGRDCTGTNRDYHAGSSGAIHSQPGDAPYGKKGVLSFLAVVLETHSSLRIQRQRCVQLRLKRTSFLKQPW